MNDKSVIAPNERGESGRRVLLVGHRPKTKRGGPDGYVEVPVEVTPEGAIKVYIAPAPRIKLGSGLLTNSTASIYKAKSTITDCSIEFVPVDDAATYELLFYHLTGTETVADSTVRAKVVNLVPNCDPLEYRNFGLLKGDDLQASGSTTNKIAWNLYGTPV